MSLKVIIRFKKCTHQRVHQVFFYNTIYYHILDCSSFLSIIKEKFPVTKYSMSAAVTEGITFFRIQKKTM